MGALLSSLLGFFFSGKEYKVVMVGVGWHKAHAPRRRAHACARPTHP